MHVTLSSTPACTAAAEEEEEEEEDSRSDCDQTSTSSVDSKETVAVSFSPQRAASLPPAAAALAAVLAASELAVGVTSHVTVAASAVFVAASASLLPWCIAKAGSTRARVKVGAVEGKAWNARGGALAHQKPTASSMRQQQEKELAMKCRGRTLAAPPRQQQDLL
ncbi:unnamed protein product [Closterium sp. NIES-54]